MKKLAQGFNTAAQDSNPGSRSRESEALPLSYCSLQGTSAEYEIIDGDCVSPPGNLTKGPDLEEDRRDDGETN